MAIINLDEHDEPGSHWIAMVKHNNDLLVYDSFGRKTTDILPNFNKEVIDTDYDAEQQINEDNCGARCVAFLNVYDKLGFEYALLI